MKNSLIKRFTKKITLNKRGNFDVDNAANVLTGIIYIAIFLAVMLLVIAIVFGLSIFQGVGGSANLSANISTIQSGILTMVINFFGLMPTIGTILAVVILIAVIVLLVLYVRRMKDGGGQSGFAG